MLTKDEAQNVLQATMPNFTIVACAPYKNLYLFRVSFPMVGEEDFDPFFSVNYDTGEVRDFSVIEDGNIDEIANLDWHDI